LEGRDCHSLPPPRLYDSSSAAEAAEALSLGLARGLACRVAGRAGGGDRPGAANEEAALSNAATPFCDAHTPSLLITKLPSPRSPGRARARRCGWTSPRRSCRRRQTLARRSSRRASATTSSTWRPWSPSDSSSSRLRRRRTATKRAPGPPTRRWPPRPRAPAPPRPPRSRRRPARRPTPRPARVGSSSSHRSGRSRYTLSLKIPFLT